MLNMSTWQAQEIYKVKLLLYTICGMSITNTILSFLGDGHQDINVTREVVLRFPPIQFEYIGVCKIIYKPLIVEFHVLGGDKNNIYGFCVAMNQYGHLTIQRKYVLSEHDMLFPPQQRELRVTYLRIMFTYLTSRLEDVVGLEGDSCMFVVALEQDMELRNLFTVTNTADIGFLLSQTILH